MTETNQMQYQHYLVKTCKFRWRLGQLGCYLNQLQCDFGHTCSTLMAIAISVNGNVQDAKHWLRVAGHEQLDKAHNESPLAQL